MLLKDFIYVIAIFLSLFSIIILRYSIKNKNICKSIIVIDFVYIIYLYIDLLILPGILHIELELEVLILYLIAIVSAIIFIISITICVIKIKKGQIATKSKKIILITIILVVFPIIIFLSIFFREKYLINNSELIFVYYSAGNGGFGDGETFAYTIGDNYCEQISLGIDFHGYAIEKFLPKSAMPITISDIQELGYEVILNDDDISIYKNGECIHEKQFRSHYFNISFKKGFYIEQN